MWVSALLIAAVAMWWLISKTKTKPIATRSAPKETIQENDPDTITIKVHIDADELLRKRAEFQTNRIKWSGKPHGPFPIKKFTDAQWSCICDAVGRKRIIIGDTYAPRGSAPDDVAHHPARTVNSLVKHGFVETDGNGVYICTDFGAKAYEQLPYF